MGVFDRKLELPQGPTLTAAAARIRLDDREETKRARRRRETWQEEAWQYFDSLGEIKYGSTYQGNALSQLELYPGVRMESGKDPVHVDDLDDSEVPPGRAEAEELLDRLRSPVSGHAEILRRMAVNFTIAGECYLIGLDQDASEERWEVRSTREVEPKGDDWILKDATDPEGRAAGKRVLKEERDFFLRMWLPHVGSAMLADSPLHGVLDVAEELLLLGRAARAQIKSRIPAGILLWPDEISSTNERQPEGDTKPPEGDAFIETIATAVVTPIQDEADASGVVPVFVMGKGDHLDKVRLLTFERTVDAHLDTRTERAQKRLAQGLNVPPEVILGIGSSTHWNAWMVSDDTFRGHHRPLAIVCVDSLTTGYFHSGLEAAGLSKEQARRWVIWFDATNLVQRPNRSDDAKDAHDRIIISDAAARREMGYDDSDAPDDAERARREGLKRPMLQPGQTPSAEPANDGPPEEPEEENAETASAVVAAARPVPDLGRRLLAIDRELRARLEAAFDSAIRRALDRAGAKVWNKARSSKDRQLRAAVERVERFEIPATLGRNMVAAMGLQESDLIDSSLEGLEARVDRWLAQAQAAALRLVPNLSDDDRATYEAIQGRDRTDAWAWARTALQETARARLYDPSPQEEPKGESDGSVQLVPYSIIRETVARAGGAAGEHAPVTAAAKGSLFGVLEIDPVQSAFGIAQGWLMQSVMSNHQIEVDEYEWVYGDYPRERPFEPHENLDGVRFTNFDDDVLANTEAWPPFAYLTPGDHDGCFVAGTVVSAPLTGAGTERVYSGEIVDIVTASGKHLSCTPNHPILTPEGFVPAGLLHQGSYVVGARDVKRVASLVDPDHDQDPAPIEEKARSLGGSNRVISARMETASEDFHGDGKGSEVHVVRTNGLLMGRFDSTVTQPLSERDLRGRDEHAALLSRARGPSESLVGVGVPTLGFVGESGNPLAFGRGTLPIEHDLRRPDTARRYSLPQKPFANGLSVDSEGRRQRLLGFPSQVAGGDGFFIKHEPLVVPNAGSDLDAESLAMVVQNLIRDPGRTQDVDHPLTGLVTADRVIEVSRRETSCHVYNLHTARNWYLAEGLIVHNCRCDFMLVVTEMTGEAAGETAA